MPENNINIDLDQFIVEAQPHPNHNHDDDHDHDEDMEMDEAPHEEELNIQAIMKKKKMPAPFPQPKTHAPGMIPRHVLAERAKSIPVGKYQQSMASDTPCANCNCRLSNHSKKIGARCQRCDCPSFITHEQLNRIYFTEFMRWARRWIKANKKRDIKKLREIWNRFRSISHLSYCGTCDTPTFNNNLHGMVKRQEGLQCASCRQCSNCCKCVACKTCRRRKREIEICKSCNVCNQCCQCRECPVCYRDCSYNYCGYAFTDRQKRNNPGCGRCYKCCDCGDRKKVPFGSFRNPVFHKPNLKQHTVNPTSRFIAAEIECAAIQGNGKPIYDVVRRWGGATVGDGSLQISGFEVNSSPAGGDLFAQQISEICAAIKQQSGSIDHRCGLHVHVDARDMNYYDIRRLVRVYAAIEDALFSMVSPQRIEGVVDADGKLHQYCQPCGKKYIAAIEEGRLPYDKIKTDVITSVYQSASTQDVRYRKRHPSRYNALNLHSWFYRGTIECRMFDGCIEAEPIINWGILWAMIIDYAVKNSDEQVAKDMVGKPIACILKIIAGHKKLIDFVKGRVLLFGNDQARRDASDLL